MEHKFIRVFNKFAVVTAIVAAVILIGLGIAILVFPQLFLTILTCTIGAVCLISGVVIIGSLMSGVFRNCGGVK